MPSRRELVGNAPPSDDFDWSAVRWNRVTAFVGGIVALGGMLYLYPDIDSRLPVWASKILPAIPVGLIEIRGEYTRLPVRNECSDRTGRNRVTNRRVMKPT